MSLPAENKIAVKSSKKRKHTDSEDQPKTTKSKDKSSKRRKATAKEELVIPGAESAADTDVKEQADFVALVPEGAPQTVKLKKQKKEKKSKSDKKKTDGEPKDETLPAEVDVSGESTSKTEEAKEESAEQGVEEAEKTAEEPEPVTKKGRFIVFIGNLPYSATTESVTAHFAKLKPASVRHRTEKGTNKSKGYAFLEFEAYDRMLTCLKQFHHSCFEDGISPARKINVELTAGGGGAKSTDRKEKLRAKNEKLNEQRQRRAEEEEKQKKRKELKEAKKRAANGTQNQPEEPVAPAPPPDDGIHPSRRARMDVN